MKKDKLNQILPSGLANSTTVKKSVKEVLSHLIQCRQKYSNQIDENDGFFYQSLDDFRKVTKKSSPTIIEAIKTLADSKVIERKVSAKNGKKTTPTQYRFLCEGEEITNRLLGTHQTSPEASKSIEDTNTPIEKENATSEAVEANRPMTVETRSSDKKSNLEKLGILLSKISQITEIEEFEEKRKKLFQWMNDENRRYDFSPEEYRTAVSTCDEVKKNIEETHQTSPEPSKSIEDTNTPIFEENVTSEAVEANEPSISLNTEQQYFIYAEEMKKSSTLEELKDKALRLKEWMNQIDNKRNLSASVFTHFKWWVHKTMNSILESDPVVQEIIHDAIPTVEEDRRKYFPTEGKPVESEVTTDMFSVTVYDSPEALLNDLKNNPPESVSPSKCTDTPISIENVTSEAVEANRPMSAEDETTFENNNDSTVEWLEPAEEYLPF